MRKPKKKKCSIWYCFKEGQYDLQISVGGISKVVAWYCDKHAKIADEEFRAGNIKTKLPIKEYKGL